MSSGRNDSWLVITLRDIRDAKLLCIGLPGLMM